MALRHVAIELGDSSVQCQPHGFLLLSRSVLRLPVRAHDGADSQLQMLPAVRPDAVAIFVPSTDRFHKILCRRRGEA